MAASGIRIIGHDEWVRSKTRVLRVPFRRRSIRCNLILEKLIYFAFARRNRLVQSGEIAQLISFALVHVVVVIIHIDLRSMPRIRHIASFCNLHA